MEIELASLGILLILSTCTGKVQNNNCLYRYVQQPETTLNCEPYGSQLQLHCGATGPLNPTFHLVWYSGTSPDDAMKLSSLNGYQIQDIVLDTMGEKRSVSSVLRTQEISFKHVGVCFWCQIEFGGLVMPVTSNALCIEQADYYSDTLGVGSCSDSTHGGTILVDTSVVCVNISEEFADKLLNHIEASPTFAPLGLQSTQTAHETSSWRSCTVFGRESPQTVQTHDNTLTNSLHTTHSVAMSTTKTQVTATPSPSLNSFTVSGVDESSVQATMNTTGEVTADTVPRSSFEGALYAAIIVCIMFVGVIVMLIVVIACLTRKRCFCLERAGVSVRRASSRLSTLLRRNTQDSDHMTQGDVGEQVDGSSAVASRINSAQVEVSIGEQSETFSDSTDNPHNSRSSRPSANERSADSRVQNLGSSGPQENELPPELPPKPKKSSTLPPISYDHLEPITIDGLPYGYAANSSLNPSMATNVDVSSKRPRSGDHFYHILENSNDGSGLLRSATASHTSIEAGTQGGPQDIDQVSSRLKQLFDDPRYAMLVLDTQEGGGGLTKRRDFSRSSPSIVTLLQPQDSAMKRGAMERRSLRLPKWISASKSPGIYDN